MTRCCYFSCSRGAIVREAKETPKTGTVDLSWCSEHAVEYAKGCQ